MVYSIMHGYHLPLDETEEDTTAIYKQILGDVAADREMKGGDAARSKKKKSALVDVPANDPYRPCTFTAAALPRVWVVPRHLQCLGALAAGI